MNITSVRTERRAVSLQQLSFLFKCLTSVFRLVDHFVFSLLSSLITLSERFYAWCETETVCVRFQEFVRQTIFVHVDITRDILHSPLVQILFAVLRKTCVHDQRQSSV